MEQKTIECINNDYIPGIGPKVKKHLTVGKQYKSREVGDFYELKDDTNVIMSYHKSRFKEVEEDNNIDDLMGYPRIVEYYEVIKKVPLSGYKPGTKLHETKSFDEYAQYPEFFKPHYKAQYKAGDKVFIVKDRNLNGEIMPFEGKVGEYVRENDNEGTYTRKKGYMHEVQVESIITRCQEVRHATAEEIEAASAITIAGYKIEIDKEWVKIGCKSFTSREIFAYKRLLDDGVTIIYKGQEITLDKLNQIIDKLK